VAGVQRRVAHVKADGSWSFTGVPPGTHAVDVVATGKLLHAHSLTHAPARAAHSRGVSRLALPVQRASSTCLSTLALTVRPAPRL
jgi:hypothetical protein